MNNGIVLPVVKILRSLGTKKVNSTNLNSLINQYYPQQGITQAVRKLLIIVSIPIVPFQPKLINNRNHSKI
jgi:hypothetical protein